jgi:large subunit ribosomal protein L16
MALMPKRVKFRKSHRGKMRGNATRGNTVAFGEYGLMALDHVWLPARTIEACRVAVAHFLRREGRLFIRVQPNKPISAKPLEVRMGSGKGEPEYWAAVIKPGMVMFEISGIDAVTAKKCLARVAHKLPIKCRFVERKHAIA